MNKINDILILSTGGTFNKVYNEINGKLIVINSKKKIKKLFSTSFKCKIKIKTIIHKDSMYFSHKDRKKLLKTVKNTKYKKIIIIHGTDTINISARYLKENNIQKKIVFTGSMCPISICAYEGIANIALSVGFLNINKTNDVYIAMHGLVKKYNSIVKDKSLGIFRNIK